MAQNDEPPQDVAVNMLSVIFHVLGFMKPSDVTQPPQPAPNARDADILMCNWILSNTTDEAVTLNFRDWRLFDLSLQRLDTGEVIWTYTYPPPTDGSNPNDPVQVTVPLKGIFAIPRSEEDDHHPNATVSDDKPKVASEGQPSDEPGDDPLEVPPTVDLKEIIERTGIEPGVNLAIKFSLRADEFPSATIFPLWR